jgi:hypothetical protein
MTVATARLMTPDAETERGNELSQTAVSQKSELATANQRIETLAEEETSLCARKRKCLFVRSRGTSRD